MNSKQIIVYLIIIGLISLGLKLYTVDFSLPVYSDDLSFLLDSISFSNGEFFIFPQKNPGWPMFLTPFMKLIESNKFIDYSNTARTLNIIISTITIVPIYLVARKFFDEKYSMVASSLFAFEPHLNHISGFGLAEPLYILILVTTFLLISNKNEKFVYISFILVGLLWWVRFEGIVMFFAISLVYFLRFKKSNKIILKYGVCVAILVLIITPNLLERYDAFGNPLFFYFENVLFAEDYEQSLTGIQNYSANDYIEEKGSLSFIHKFILTGVYNIFSLLPRILFPYLIILLPFGIFFSLRSFDQKKEYIQTNWIVILIILGALTALFANVPERRYLYPLLPFLIIFATIPIQRVTEYGLNTFSFSNQRKNIFLIIVLILVILLSILFTVTRFENVDTVYEHEQIEFARFLNNQLTGRIYDSGEAVNYLGYARIVDSNDIFDKQKIIGPGHYYESYAVFLAKQETDLQPLANIEKVYVDGETIDELISSGKDNELKYLAITKDGPYYHPFLQDVYLNEQNYPFLIKEFDSKEHGFHKFHVKVFQVDYEKFEKRK